ncbi:hypothetical protein ES703_56160 [subsurface metagenome]
MNRIYRGTSMPNGHVSLQGTSSFSRSAQRISLSVSAPVGQTSIQAPQNLQPDSLSEGARLPTMVSPFE